MGLSSEQLVACKANVGCKRGATNYGGGNCNAVLAVGTVDALLNVLEVIPIFAIIVGNVKFVFFALKDGGLAVSAFFALITLFTLDLLFALVPLFPLLTILVIGNGKGGGRVIGVGKELM